MKIQLRRSNNVDGKTVVMFVFDGYEAGTLEIPWQCWLIWQKSLLKGMAASDVPFEMEVTGWTLGNPEPPRVVAQLPKTGATSQPREIEVDSDAVADLMLSGARVAPLPKTRPTVAPAEIAAEAAAVEAAFLATGKLVPLPAEGQSVLVAPTQHRGGQTPK